MNRLITWIIIVLLFLIAMALFGCHNTSDKLNLHDPPPPSGQLWKAAKQANWLVTVSIVGIAFGIFATMNGQKWGIAAIVSCCVSLFMVLAVARFAFWMALTGMIGSTGLCVASILVRKKALIEIIRGVQNHRDATIEHDVLDGNLRLSQSKSTEKIVNKIKAKKCISTPEMT